MPVDLSREVTDDPRWEPGMPVLDRQVPAATSGAMDRPNRSPTQVRSVPETAPTPFQAHYVTLSVVALVAGTIAITALEVGLPPSSVLVRACVVIGAPLLAITTIDAVLRIWRSAWAWLPVDRTRAAFRLFWVVAAIVLLAAVVAVSTWVLTS